MKIKKILEELIFKSEVTKKEDIGSFAMQIKNKLIEKGFDKQEAAKIVSSFIKDGNSSGYFNKILANDASRPDISVDVEGSNVTISIIPDNKDETPKSFSYNGATQKVNLVAPPAPRIAKSTAVMKPSNDKYLKVKGGLYYK